MRSGGSRNSRSAALEELLGTLLPQFWVQVAVTSVIGAIGIGGLVYWHRRPPGSPGAGLGAFLFWAFLVLAGAALTGLALWLNGGDEGIEEE